MAASWHDDHDERRRARGREADARARTFEWTSRRDRLPPLDYSAPLIPVPRSAAAASKRRSWPYPSDSQRIHSKRHHAAAPGATAGASNERPISRSLPEYSTWSRAEWPARREDEGGQAPPTPGRVPAGAHRGALSGDFSGSVHTRPTVDDRPAVNRLDLGGFRDKTSSDGPNLKFTESVSGADEAFLNPRRRTDADDGAQQREPAAAYSLAHLVHPPANTTSGGTADFRASPPALGPPLPRVGTTTAAANYLSTTPAAADPVPEIKMASPSDDERPLPPASSDTRHRQLSPGGPSRPPSCSRQVSQSSHHSATSGPSVSAEMSRNPSESGSEGKISLAGDVSDGDGEQPKRRKRTRVLMTHTQQTALFKLWKETKFPTGEQRDRIAGVINLTPRQVQVWFQNQRQKARKQMHHAGGGGGEADEFPELLPSPSGRPQSMDSVIGSPWASSSSSYPGGSFSSAQSPYAPSGALPLPPPQLAAVPPPSRGGYGYPPPPATAREASFASRHGPDYPPQHTRPSTSEAAYGPYRSSGLAPTSYYHNPAGFQSPPLTGSSTQSYWGGPPPDRLGSSSGASGYWDRPGSSRDRDRDRSRPSTSAHFQLHRQSPFSFTALPFSPPPSSDGPGPDSYFARNRSSKSRSGESARQKSSGSDYSRSTRPPSSWSWGQPRPHSQQSQLSQRPQSSQSQSQSFAPPPPPPPVPHPHSHPQPHGTSSSSAVTEWKRSLSPPPAIQPPQHLPPELAKLAITRPVSLPSEPRARDTLPQISPAFSSSPTHMADMDYPPPPPQAAMRYDRYDERPYDRYDRGLPPPPPATASQQALSADLRARSLSYDADGGRGSGGPKVELGRGETLKRRARDRSRDGEGDRSSSRDRVATLPSLRNMLS